MAIELQARTATAGDCTTGFNVILDKEYTVKELIDEILTTRPREWGDINVNGKLICKYSKGQLITQPDQSHLSEKIEKAWSVGGWSLMTYDIKTNQ